MYKHNFITQRIECNDPIKMAKASGFLWNKQMMIHMNCRGYAVAQFMQPEPSKYSRGPNMEAQSFMQPEQGYFAHHPGRFFYIKCHDSGEFFSIPYEPVRKKHSSFCFSVGKDSLIWRVTQLDLDIHLTLTLPADDVFEMWQLHIVNHGPKQKNFSIYPYFSIGYMSWMNQSANYNQQLNGIVAQAITPYQKVEDYFNNQHLRDNTFLLADKQPDSWTVNQAQFEGEGGLHDPDGLKANVLPKNKACYETPVAVMQFNCQLVCHQQASYSFIFGAAKDQTEIAKIKEKYMSNKGFTKVNQAYKSYLQGADEGIKVESTDMEFDQFVNHWLPRQVFYHGDVNRLTTDPQTRNYLQDAMGICYIAADKTKAALLNTLAQQYISGALPDGILLHEKAELKYINLIPHSDHCIWLPLCLQVYLNETNDVNLLEQLIGFKDSDQRLPVSAHVDLAMDYLITATDQRNLSFIEQGDWCDPMNMVGYKGKGVSAWLSLASAYSLKVWCEICETYLKKSKNKANIARYLQAANTINKAVNQYLWADNWYARGITDEGRIFGTAEDQQGQIYLNPQSWAILSGAASEQQIVAMNTAIKKQLQTPYGVMMLAPSYTEMHEDIGRLTQKYPGVSENGSIYNHAAIFYAFSLYQQGQGDDAFRIISQMLPNQKDVEQRQQLPSFVPNYYRGAYFQMPEMAGRSSQLFNTGTVAWLYRCVVEQLCGLKGIAGALHIDPKLPKSLSTLTVSKKFLGAQFKIVMKKQSSIDKCLVFYGDHRLKNNTFTHIKAGETYHLKVLLPNCE